MQAELFIHGAHHDYLSLSWERATDVWEKLNFFNGVMEYSKSPTHGSRRIQSGFDAVDVEFCTNTPVSKADICVQLDGKTYDMVMRLSFSFGASDKMIFDARLERNPDI